MDNYNAFQQQAENIFEQLQRIVEQKDTATIVSQLKPICQRFSNIYDQFYSSEIDYQNEMRNYKSFLQHLINISHSSSDSIEDINVNYKQGQQRMRIDSFLSTRYGLIQQLESILTGFKTIFLKVIGQQFIQIVVIEVKDKESGKFIPQPVQMKDWTELASLINNRTENLQGRLQQNKNLITRFKSREHAKVLSNLYTDRRQQYEDTYSQARRRINIFYSRTKRFYGQSLLLYKKHNKWIRFWVANLGDLKQGYVTMVVRHQEDLPNDPELRMEIFTKYIGQVDNIAGTLLQDVQTQENQQISVKSGRAQTGSHQELINLIKAISVSTKDPVTLIKDAFNKDLARSAEGIGRRNRILDPRKDKEKLESLLSAQGLNSAKTALNNIVSDINNKI